MSIASFLRSTGNEEPLPPESCLLSTFSSLLSQVGLVLDTKGLNRIMQVAYCTKSTALQKKFTYVNSGFPVDRAVSITVLYVL